MSLGGKQSAPATPDYTGAAIASGELGIGNTIAQSELNNPNVNSPYGSVSYGSPGDTTYGGGGYSSSPYMTSPAYSGNVASPVNAAQPYASGGTGGGITFGGVSGSAGSNESPIVQNTPGVNLIGGEAGTILNDISPGGGKGKGATPGTPSYTLTSAQTNPQDRQTENITLSPAQQQLLNSQEGSQIAAGLTGNNVAGSLLKNTTGQLNLSGLPNATDGASQINSNVVNALYNQGAQYLNPQFAQEQEGLNAQLVAQGLGPLGTSGNEAAQNAETNFANQKQQAYSNLLDSAQQQGTEAGALAQQENIAGANQGISEQEQQQQLPLQELQSLLGISQPTLPTATSTGGTSAAAAPNLLDALSSSYASQLGSVNANNALAGQTTSTLGSLGALALLLG